MNTRPCQVIGCYDAVEAYKRYSPKSFGGYLKKLKTGYKKKVKYKGYYDHSILGDNIEDNTDDLNDDIPKSGKQKRYLISRKQSTGLITVTQVAREIDISVSTVYRLIKSNKILATVNQSGIRELTDGSFEELKKRSEDKERRKSIFDLAERCGKKPETTKKVLSRNRKLSKHLFEEKLHRWLKLYK
jgi:hypothetical protein